MPKVTGTSDFMNGSLVFAGTRVPVQNLFECLAEGSSIKEILKGCSIVSFGQVRLLLPKRQNKEVKNEK